MAGSQAQVHTFAGNAQHTSLYNTPAQNLNRIKWTYDIDLNNSGQFAHYGAPLVTASNTIITPVKTATNGFNVVALNADGTEKYTLNSNYVLPSFNWIPVFQPVIAPGPSGTRLYYAGIGGTIYYIDNPDSNTPGAPTRLVFFGDAAYDADQAGFNSTVFIDSPITSDSDGNIFFTFRTLGTPPSQIAANQSGIARIDSTGTGSFVLATDAASDVNITRVPHNSAPALSADEQTLYVMVKWATNAYYGYIVALDATSLATTGKAFLRDPRNGNNAGVLDDSTASPMVAPDGDVYIGIFGNPNNGSRGFLARFNSDLTVEKTPGGFGWDYTAGLVPASMVPSYTGSSTYLLFAKYNNYAFSDGDGVNRIALLDPNETQVDPHTTAAGLIQMREVFTVIGPVRDQNFPSYPYAVREWCINAPAVNPGTGSIIVPCEDGRVYQWNLTTNSLTQAIVLNAGLGQPYVPTVVGPDGTVYVLNGGTLFSIGGYDDIAVTIESDSPDMRPAVSGDSITFTAKVVSLGSGTPTGTFDFEALTYDGTTPVVTSLATGVAIDVNGEASVTTTALTANGVNFLGNYHVTATYSGDGTFGSGSAMLHQKVHAYGSSTAVSSSSPSTFGSDVTFTATVASVPSGMGTPTGQVTFTSGGTVLAQKPLVSGSASFDATGLGVGAHTIEATYASDTVFASSTGNTSHTVTAATTTDLSSSPNPSTGGQNVTLTATVSAVDGGAGTPAGTVEFVSGATVLGSVAVNGSGVAELTTSALAVGNHTIVATFTGSTGWLGSDDNVSHDVQGNSSTSVSSSPNPSNFGDSVTFTAVITSTGGAGTPTGTVDFKEGATVLASVAVDGSGEAEFSTSTLSPGSHTIVAEFTGTGGWQNSSDSVEHVVNVVNDIFAPTPPGNLHVTYGPKNRITLHWDASTDIGSGVSHYEIFRSNRPSTGFSIVGTTTGTSFGDVLSRRQTRYYYVIVYDFAGNSARSVTISVTGFRSGFPDGPGDGFGFGGGGGIGGIGGGGGIWWGGSHRIDDGRVLFRRR